MLGAPFSMVELEKSNSMVGMEGSVVDGGFWGGGGWEWSGEILDFLIVGLEAWR